MDSLGAFQPRISDLTKGGPVGPCVSSSSSSLSQSYRGLSVKLPKIFGRPIRLGCSLTESGAVSNKPRISSGLILLGKGLRFAASLHARISREDSARVAESSWFILAASATGIASFLLPVFATGPEPLLELCIFKGVVWTGVAFSRD